MNKETASIKRRPRNRNQDGSLPKGQTPLISFPAKHIGLIKRVKLADWIQISMLILIAGSLAYAILSYRLSEQLTKAEKVPWVSISDITTLDATKQGIIECKFKLKNWSGFPANVFEKKFKLVDRNGLVLAESSTQAGPSPLFPNDEMEGASIMQINVSSIRDADGSEVGAEEIMSAIRSHRLSLDAIIKYTDIYGRHVEYYCSYFWQPENERWGIRSSKIVLPEGAF